MSLPVRAPLRSQLLLALAPVLAALPAAAQQTLQAKRIASDPRIEIRALPYTIDACGSYVLTGCLTGVAGQDGITITASDVTLDLNGFSLIGVPGSLAGIRIPGAPQNITVKNGEIVDWGDAGIVGLSSRHCTFRDLGLKRNAGHGLQTGVFALVQSCFAYQNGGEGFRAFGGTWADCVAEQNVGSGFWGGGEMTRCIASGNDGNGFEGVNGGLSDCRASSNDLDGFKGAGRFTRCHASSNFGDGFDLGVSQLVQCTATSNDGSGIRVQINGTISNCTASENDGDGFWVSNQGLIRESCAINNGDDGIQGGTRMQVVDCTVTGNVARGIFVNSGSTARGNTCEGNDIGVYALNGGNRIDGNLLVGNGTGIEVNGAGNLVLRNSASGSTTAGFTLAAGNSVGPIVNVAGSGDISTVGDPDNAHPWANFEF